MAIGAARRLAGVARDSDEELVREVRAGMPGSFELLVRRHRARLRRAVRSMLRDRSDVEDVVQQTFLQAFTALDGFAGDAPFAAWLTRIATNEVLMRARRSRRAERAAVRLVPLLGAGGTPEQEAASREAVARVQAALPRLLPHHREVIQLTTLHELSHAAVAAQLGVTEGAVKVRLHRAREALRGLVDSPREPRTPRLVLARPRAGLIASCRKGAGTG